jgi:hypothetical protein
MHAFYLDLFNFEIEFQGSVLIGLLVGFRAIFLDDPSSINFFFDIIWDSVDRLEACKKSFMSLMVIGTSAFCCLRHVNQLIDLVSYYYAPHLVFPRIVGSLRAAGDEHVMSGKGPDTGRITELLRSFVTIIIDKFIDFLVPLKYDAVVP